MKFTNDNGMKSAMCVLERVTLSDKEFTALPYAENTDPSKGAIRYGVVLQSKSSDKSISFYKTFLGDDGISVDFAENGKIAHKSFCGRQRYKEAAKFMTDQGIMATRILPYSTMTTPLSAIFADLVQRKGAAYIGATWLKVARWYWCSVFSQRYSSQIESTSARDFEQVLNWIDGGEPPEVVRTFGFRSDALQEITSIRNAIYKGVLCLLARAGAKDFGGGGKLSTHLFYSTNQDHHHIFPTSALKRLGIQDRRAGTIINKTLINYAVNRSIGGRLPSDYLRDWQDKLGTALFDDILGSHAVDPALLSSDNWERYLLDRRERLRQLVASACGGNVQPFSDAVDLEVEEDEEA